MSSFRSSITAGSNRPGRTPGSACSLPGGARAALRPRPPRRLDCGGSQLTALCVFALPQEPVVARAAAIRWVASASAGVMLCPPSLRAAAALCARRGRSAGSRRAPQSSRCSQAAPPRREVLESVVPELFGRAVFRVVRPGLGRHDLVEELVLVERGARFGVRLRHRDRLAEHPPAVPDTGDQ